ncbi:phage tail tape measure protein [Mycolicibacterium vaccae]|uniref:phage tail tape measure protein n=1 Tax=Mycolicibacterium vaccae TaxID=1810 RepID=UPI003CFE9359
MIVGTELDDNSIRQVTNDIQRRFDRMGQNLGSDFMDQFADSAAANAPKVQKAVDRAADATGRLRVEQEKLDRLTSSGDTDRAKLVAQSERVAKARRDEARAYKEAAAAAQEYGDAGEDASASFMAGFRSGLGNFGGLGQSAADGFGGGLIGGLSAARMAGIGVTGGAALAGGFVTAAVAGVASLGPAIADGITNIAVTDQFQARMGLDESSMAQYAQAAGQAYANNFGASVQDNLGTAQAALRAGIIDAGATDSEVQGVIQQLEGVSAVTDATTQELARSITTLMRTGLAGSVSEASDIITAGFQAGLDVSGDWLDTVNEYSTQFRKFGLDASEVLTLLNQGIEGGARDTDKVADSLKEFAIRAVDGSKTTAEGFAALGFDADEMGRRFAEGGQSAKVALDATFDAIQRIDDPMQQALVWQRLFGTQFEDMGDAINQFNLDEVGAEFDDLKGTSDRTTKTAASNFASEWETATRTVSQRFADLKTDLANWFTDLPWIRELPGIITALASPPGIPEGYSNPNPPVPATPLELSPANPGAINNPGGLLPAGPGTNLLDNLLNPNPGTPAPESMDPDSGPAPAPPVPGERTPILTDSQAEAAKEAEKADEKPVIDPSRFSLDSVPIGNFAPADMLPGAAPVAAPPSGPVTWDPQEQAYGAHVVDPQKVFDAETSLISQRQSVENARLRLLELEAEGNATAAELNAARTAITLAERGYVSQQQKLAEAQQGTWEKLEDTAKQFTGGMEDIGAALDADFGLSEGLPGLAENLTKFIANLAAAPLLGPLAAIKEAAGDEGSGLLGMAASQGMFGPRFMPERQNTPAGTPTDVPAGMPASLPASGNSNVNAMFALAQSASGRTKYAPASDLINGLADCSGSISDLYEVLTTGKSTAARMFTTTNFASDEEAAKLGFRPGFMPGALNVGVNPYPGQSGHMAATLPNGINFEGGGATGGGAQYGGNAAGALDPQFEKQYHLPIAGLPTLPVTSPATPVAAGPMPSPLSGLPIPLPVTIVGGAVPSAGPLPTVPTTPESPTWNPTAPSTTPSSPTLPGLYSPENTNPALTPPIPGVPGPLPSAGPGGGSTLPGTGMPQSAPFGTPPADPIGQSVITGQSPQPVPGAGSGMNQGISGLPLAAIQTAAGGLDALAPGAGAAANLGIQLANRAIGYGAQQVGNLASGFFETFTLSGSGGMTDPLKTLPGRLLAGIAGARPSLPNTAGGSASPQSGKDQKQQNPQQPQPNNGPLVEIKEVHQAPGESPDAVANSVASQFRSYEYSGGFNGR